MYRYGTGLPVSIILFPKIRVPGLSKEFLSQSQLSQRFLSDFGTSKFLWQLGILVRWECLGTVSARDGHGTELPVPRMIVPGTGVPKLKIPGLSQRFLSQSKESQGIESHGMTLGQPEFFSTRVSGTVPGFWIFYWKTWKTLQISSNESLLHLN